MRPALPILLVVLLAVPAVARTWRVPSEAPTIAAGLDSASTGDEVVLACGTYEETNLQLKSGVTLRSESSDPDCAIIDATNVAWHISVVQCWWQDGARLEGLTVTGGHALDHYYGDHAGALKVFGSDLEVVDCVFTGNEAVVGGAINLSAEANSIFRRCVITGNTAGFGGGIELIGGTVLTAYDCVIVDNTATGTQPEHLIWSDGLIRPDALARLICCDVDPDQWGGGGTVEVIDEDCGATRNEVRTWSGVKDLFR